MSSFIVLPAADRHWLVQPGNRLASFRACSLHEDSLL